MEDIGPALKLLISLVIGAAIGLEREWQDTEVEKRQKRTAPGELGVRTFSLMTTLGALVGMLSATQPVLSALFSISFFLLLLAYYYFHTSTTGDYGITTEIAAIFSFLIGLLIALNTLPIQLVLAVSVVLMLILSHKKKIRKAVAGVRLQELNAFISYAIIALVILPFLPDTAYTIRDIPVIETVISAFGVSLEKLRGIEIINPFKLWQIVAIITGVDIAGYVLSRQIGRNKGLLVASITGGFISSTATTISLAQQSVRTQTANNLVAAALLSNVASFFQIIVLIATVNAGFLVALTPVIIALLLSGFAAGIFFLFRRRPQRKYKSEESKNDREIFALVPALKFAGIFLLVRILSKTALELFGRNGFLVASALAALTGMDVVTINTSELVRSAISAETGIWAIVLANAVNLGSKSVYSFLQGSRAFAIPFTVSALLMIASTAAAALLF